MTSPDTVPRQSSSDPDLNIKVSNSETLIRRSTRSSVSSSRHSKSSYWDSWSNANKLGDYINQRKGKLDSSKHSEFTEESLDEHNKLHGRITRRAHTSNYIYGADDRNNNCSPYYQGLVDATLAINREKNIGTGADSPGRESHTTSVFTKYSISSSLSTFFITVHELGSSCFTCRKPGSNKNPSTTAAAAVLQPLKPVSSSSTVVALATSSKEIKTDQIEATYPPCTLLVDKEKPLRERVPEPSAPTTVFLPAKTVINNYDERKETNIYRMNQQFIMADKYRPKALKDFICNRGQATRLQDLVKNGGGGCDRVIFEGPPGVGKRTMIWAMLREIYGPDRVQTRDECKAFDLKGESIGRIEVNVRESSKHVEVNLSDLRGYEKHVIVELMKGTQAKTTSDSNKALPSSPENPRAIILCEADKLKTDSLLYIKWLLERYEGNNKVLFCCFDVSKLDPIRPLCTLIQLLPPSKEEIVEVLEFIAKQEGIYLPHNLVEKIADKSKNNLRQAIRSFEACWYSSYPFHEDQTILTGWEQDIENIAKNMIEERSPKQLYIIRGKLQTLMEHDVSPEFIFMSLVQEVKKLLQENFHPQIDCLYKKYMHGDNMNIESEDDMETKVIDPIRRNMRMFLKMEEFIAKFMSCYNIQSRMGSAGNYTPSPLANAGILTPL